VDFSVWKPKAALAVPQVARKQWVAGPWWLGDGVDDVADGKVVGRLDEYFDDVVDVVEDCVEDVVVVADDVERVVAVVVEAVERRPYFAAGLVLVVAASVVAVVGLEVCRDLAIPISWEAP
jgi:hypothetical protein